MDQELFGERGRVLEEDFFRRQNAELLTSMRSQSESVHVRDALRSTTGIDDEVLLAHMMELGMTAATLTAAALIPLVTIAWADGTLEEAERRQIFRDPLVAGLSEAANTLLTSWLLTPPDATLFDTWVAYTRSLLPKVSPSARSSLKSATIARATVVAEAAGGGPYRVGRRTSAEEQSVIQKIEAAFEA
ncbi:MAG: hypothetical protein ABI577_03630 [bacterium]